jgi:hypothetical protein
MDLSERAEKEMQQKRTEANSSCCNCGRKLSTQSITAACQEAGVWSAYFLRLWCSTWESTTDTCPGMSASEENLPAVWALDY